MPVEDQPTILMLKLQLVVESRSHHVGGSYVASGILGEPL